MFSYIPVLAAVIGGFILLLMGRPLWDPRANRARNPFTGQYMKTYYAIIAAVMLIILLPTLDTSLRRGIAELLGWTLMTYGPLPFTIILTVMVLAVYRKFKGN